jgi:hypothetical protein
MFLSALETDGPRTPNASAARDTVGHHSLRFDSIGVATPRPALSSPCDSAGVSPSRQASAFRSSAIADSNPVRVVYWL